MTVKYFVEWKNLDVFLSALNPKLFDNYPHCIGLNKHDKVNGKSIRRPSLYTTGERTMPKQFFPPNSHQQVNWSDCSLYFLIQCGITCKNNTYKMDFYNVIQAFIRNCYDLRAVAPNWNRHTICALHAFKYFTSS